MSSAPGHLELNTIIYRIIILYSLVNISRYLLLLYSCLRKLRFLTSIQKKHWKAPTSEKNSSMKAVLSTAISTSSASSSCVSCFCEGRKGRGETKTPRKHWPRAKHRGLYLQCAPHTRPADRRTALRRISLSYVSLNPSSQRVCICVSLNRTRTLMQHCKPTTGSSAGEGSARSAGDLCSIAGLGRSGLGRSAGEGKDYPP